MNHQDRGGLDRHEPRWMVVHVVALVFFVANAVGMGRSYQQVWETYAPVFPTSTS